MQTDHLTPTRGPDLVLINNKRRTFYLVEDLWVKIKESKKIDKFWTLADNNPPTTTKNKNKTNEKTNKNQNQKLLAQSARAVEYTDCFSAEG